MSNSFSFPWGFGYTSFKPPVVSQKGIYSLSDDELIEFTVKTFEGKELSMVLAAEDIKTEARYQQVLAECGVGWKTVKSWTVWSLTGFRVTYSRDRKGQQFRREKIEEAVR